MSGNYKYPHPDEIPATVDEALKVLADILPEETLAKIVTMDDEEILLLHIGLGTAIRNQFGLWDKNSPLLADLAARIGSVHPDDASGELIRLLRDKLSCQ